jgi:hypothetical protein
MWRSPGTYAGGWCIWAADSACHDGHERLCCKERYTTYGRCVRVGHGRCNREASTTMSSALARYSHLHSPSGQASLLQLLYVQAISVSYG